MDGQPTSQLWPPIPIDHTGRSPFVNLPPYMSHLYHLYPPWEPTAHKPHAPEPPAFAAYPLDVDVLDQNGFHVPHRERELNTVLFYLAETSQLICDGIISRNFINFSQYGINFKRQWTDLTACLEIIWVEQRTKPIFDKPLHKYWFHLHTKGQQPRRPYWLRSCIVPQYQRITTEIWSTILGAAEKAERARQLVEFDVTKVRNHCIRLEHLDRVYPRPDENPILNISFPSTSH